jgi:acyl-CoA dehydrogenase
LIGDNVPFSAAVAAIPGLAAAVQAATHAAEDVDRKSRFPFEAIDLVKEARFLSCSLPEALGGRSWGIAELAVIARALGGACSSAGMVFAMHHAQALALAHHAYEGPIADLTARIAADESLLASATTEITTGGDVRSSTCSVIVDGDRLVLEKNAPVISYAEYADYICATARRGPDSPPNDQVLVVCPRGDTTLEMTKPWDVLGFRGTCSPGYILKTRTSPTFVVPVDYSTISETTMLPVSHILWSSVWLGIADAAMQKARKATRDAVRKSDAKTVPQAAKLADLTVAHQKLDALVTREINRYVGFLASGSAEPTVGFTIAMNNLKLASSTDVVDIVTGALALVGINGYREDHPLSLGRQLRDCFAPQLMVSNDRIRANNAQLVLMHRG